MAHEHSLHPMRLAVVLDLEPQPGSSLEAFIVESNRGGLVRFVKDEGSGLESLVHMGAG